MSVLEGINHGIRTATGVMGYLDQRERMDQQAVRQERADERAEIAFRNQQQYMQDQIRRGREDEAREHQKRLFTAGFAILNGIEPSNMTTVVDSFNYLHPEMINQGEGGTKKKVTNIFPLVDSNTNTYLESDRGERQYGIELEIEREDGTTYRAPMDRERSVDGDDIAMLKESDILGIVNSLERSLIENGEESFINNKRQLMSQMKAMAMMNGADPAVFKAVKDEFALEEYKHKNAIELVEAKGNQARKTLDHRESIRGDDLPDEIELIDYAVENGWTKKQAMDAILRNNNKGRSREDLVLFYVKQIQQMEEAKSKTIRSGEKYEPRSLKEIRKEAVQLADIGRVDTGGGGSDNSGVGDEDEVFDAEEFLDQF